MYNKRYFEKYALLSQVKCYSNCLDTTEYENPDYQSEELSIGLEVVEAIKSRQGEERFIINEVSVN